MLIDRKIKQICIGLYFSFFIVSTLISPTSIFANAPSGKSSLSGFIKDAGTKETLISATIRIEGTKLGAYTNKLGYYSINNIIPGEYIVTISLLGYETLTKTVQFKSGESVRADYELISGGVKTEEINVFANREIETRQISISKVNVPIEQIKQIRVGGESDVFRTLQFLPGVLTSSQLSSGLFVRGGSPDQNLVLLDGSTVYNPTHLFGFISTFNSDALKEVELIKGGFNAEYGGRLSAVLNITQKDGNRDRISANGSIGVISSRLGLEGPLGNGSWFISGRRTYFDLLKGILPENPDNPIPNFSFYDLNGKISQDFGKNDKVSFSGFLSQDQLDYSSFGLSLLLELGNNLASTRWTHIFADDLFLATNLSYSHYFNNFAGDQSGYEFIIDNSVTDITLKSDLEWFASESLTTKFGFESSAFTFDYHQNFTGETDSTAEGSVSGSTRFSVKDIHTSAYGQAKYSFSELFGIQGGLRVNYWDLSKILSLDPRVSLKYRFTDRIAAKASWGIFHQNLRLATQPDFSFFDTWLPTDSTVEASRAEHYIFSIETQPAIGFDLNFDVYYKKLHNISELNRNAFEIETVDDVFYIGEADAYGAEIFLQKKIGKFNGWLGYAIGVINAKFDSVNNGRTFNPRYDRTHDFKVVGNYNLNKNWNFGATFLFQSGQPYTGATSRFQSYLPVQNFGRGKIFPSERFGLRLPPSHQLNINVTYSFKIKAIDSKIVLDVFNVYNRRDIWFRYYNTREANTTVEDVRLLPILPTLSFEFKY